MLLVRHRLPQWGQGSFPPSVMPASLIKFSPAAFEPTAPSTMHCDSAVPAEWQQNMSIPFFCGPTSRLETWATLLCRLCCLHEDKFFEILSVHFSQRPSLVKATHPHDQHDWTATALHRCLHVASENISSVPLACNSCRSIILATRLTHWHLQCNEPIWRLKKTDSLKKDESSMSKEMEPRTCNL